MAFGETVAADETARFKGYADELTALQRERAAVSGKPQRALHVKQHFGAVGELTVSAASPAARMGVFADVGKTWPVYVRFSNGSSSSQGDDKPDVRGFALKLVGVPGPKLIPGLEGEETQDFLFIDTQTLPFRDPEEFMAFVRAAKDGPLKLLPRLISAYGFGRAFGVIKQALAAKKVTSYATHSFHTGAPIAFGATAAKLALVPVGSGGVAPVVSGPDYLQQDLIARLQQGALSWSLRAQLFVDEASTPIEDTSVLWSGPWLELASLTLPQQAVDSPRGKEISELVNQLSFDPWHAIAGHRPLGAIMRARGATYGASVLGRNAAPEPKSVLSV